MKLLLMSIMFAASSVIQAQQNDHFLEDLLKKDSAFKEVLGHRNEWNVQILYSAIDRNKKGRPVFTEHSFNLDNGRYYYPASTVKLPVALLALQRLHELNIPGLDMNSTMITGAEGYRQTSVEHDSSSENYLPSIAHYVKKILLVSDNDAFNRLYEFLGQEYINNKLHEMGYDSVQIIHRLNIFLSEEENRQTNPVRFYDKNGKLLYSQPGIKSSLEYAKRNTRLGKGFMRGDSVVNEAFDFSKKNRMPLDVLHNIVKSVMFPGSVQKKQRFNLTAEDYALVRKYMSMMPFESRFPRYDTAEYPTNYVKFIFYGGSSSKPVEGVRIFNKPGDAYGFLIDGTYFADFRNKVEFLLSAVIHCNSDGIFNDDKYDYDTIGLPFMKNLGHAIYNYELNRKKKRLPDLSAFSFSY